MSCVEEGRMVEFPIVVDTAAMRLAPVPSNPGAYFQMLLSYGGAGGAIQIVYGPPGFTMPIQHLLAYGPHRHYHRTVRERHYVLGGDFPVWHWETPGAPGKLTRLRRHHYLENPPLTLHGISPGEVPETGWKILQWTDGAGTDLTEPAAATETFEVGFDGAAPDLPFDQPVWCYAEDMVWMAHGTQPEWQIKQLAGAANGLQAVSLVAIPPRWEGRLGGLSSRREPANWVFVVSGDLALDFSPTGAQNGDRRGVPLREDGFLAWADEGAPAAGQTAGGCVVLCVGHQLDAG